MPLTPEDVQNKRFTVVRFGKAGYDEEEVDTFLDEIEAEMRRLLAESRRRCAASGAAAAEQARRSRRRAEPAPEPPAGRGPERDRAADPAARAAHGGRRDRPGEVPRPSRC